MRHYYYLEIKQYSHLPHYYEYQIADGGVMPRIYKYLKRAIFAANHSITFNVEKLGYKIVIPNETHPACNGECKFAVTLQNKQNDVRKEIRIYAMTINNERPL